MAETNAIERIERPIAIKALVGSHNYNLNDETSNKDYKYFVYPNFDDLYDAKYFALPSQTSEDMDFDVHDMRKIPQLFWKANINFLEILFSTEIEHSASATMWNAERIVELWQELFNRRDDIAKMNVPYLYHACKGMHFNKIQYLKKGTKGTMHLVKKFGYDTKQALHAYRCLDFIHRFAWYGYDFAKAMRYDDTERAKMLSIKYGFFTEEAYTQLIDKKYQEFERYQPLYESHKPNEELNRFVQETIREITSISLC